jgi:hypothetical protein
MSDFEPGESHDMVRMRGMGLRIMREQDLEDQIFDVDPQRAARAVDWLASQRMQEQEVKRFKRLRRIKCLQLA